MKGIKDLNLQEPLDKVVIKLGAEWCAPCKNIAPAYERLSEKYPQLSFYSLDVDDEEVASFIDDFKLRHLVRTIPMFMYFENGKLFTHTKGASEFNLTNWLKCEVSSAK